MRTFLWVGLVCCAVWACQEADPRGPKGNPGGDDPGKKVQPLRVLAPDQEYEGKSLEDWAIEYARWSFSQTTCNSPAYDRDGSLCALQQADSDSPVFFLERSDYGRTLETKTLRTNCHVPAGKAILAPVAVVVLDDTDAEVPSPETELEQEAVEIKDSVRSMMLVADGEQVEDMRYRGVGPTRTTYTVPPEPNVFSCDGAPGIADTTIEPAFLVGFLALFEPPEPGVHEIEFASTFNWGHAQYAFHVSNEFTVDEPSE